MERIPSDGEARRIVSLSTLLAPPVADDVVDVAKAAPEDPAEQLRLEAARIFDAAREQGLREGRTQAETEISRARDDARREIQAAHADEQARLEAMQAEGARLLRTLEALPAESESAMEELVVEVAYAAVLRILGATSADMSLVRALCQQALADMTQRPVVMRVHPLDADAVAALADGSDVRVEADVRLQRGQCRLQTRRGDYDTSLEERLDALKLAFLAGLRETQTTP
jgi:flagellar biosynthesis/type III secretory pathway protein FliH